MDCVSGDIMKFVLLAEHLHELRLTRTGRAAGTAMRVAEVWNCAIESPLSSIAEITYRETDLPRPFDGMFVRLRGSADGSEKATIYVDKNLPRHLKEFVAIKEMMHCWSPPATYVGTPDSAAKLIGALCEKQGRYTASVAADNNAILAAGEVILPHYTVERHIGVGHDSAQIAAHHGLHPDITDMICSLDFLHHRKNGEF